MEKAIRLLFILNVATVIIITGGCKKSYYSTLSSYEEVRSALLEKSRRGGKKHFINVDQKIEAHYTDLTGKMLDVQQRAPNGVSLCDYSSPDVLLKEYSRIAMCGTSGNILSWKYEISSTNFLTFANPINTSNNNRKTRGVVRIFDGSTEIYNEVTFNVVIIDNGTDPNNLNANIYSVIFTSSSINTLYLLNPNYELRVGAFIMNDCDEYQPAIISVANTGLPHTGVNDVCRKSDICYINPGTTGVFISGVDPLALCPSGYLYPDLQQVEFTVDNGVNWYPIENALTSFTAIQNTNYLNPFEASGVVPQSGSGYSLSSGTYTMEFRYRDVKVQSGFNMSRITQITSADIDCVSPWYKDPVTYSVMY